MAASTTSVSDAVAELLQKVHMKDVVIHQLKERCILMQEDYEHNYRLVQHQATELQSLRNKCSAQEKVLKQLETRCQLQASKLRDADNEVHRQTQAIQSVAESLRAQLIVTQNEQGNWQRKCADAELEVSNLRQELQLLAGKSARNAEMVRREAFVENDTLMKDRERLLRVREDQLVREVQAVEQRNVELSTELARVKELKDTSEVRLEELTKVVARKEFLIQQCQEQLNEVKKAHAQQLHKLELEVQSATVLKEQIERNNTSQMLTVQREVERRAHENELLEQKITALRQQHEMELRRKSDERDEIIRSFEDKMRQLGDRLRDAESRETVALEDAERLRRKAAEGKKIASALTVGSTALEDRVEEMQRLLVSKDVELHRLKMDVDRWAGIAERNGREAEELRSEFDRRAWQDRLADENAQLSRIEQWKQVGTAKTHQHPSRGGGGGDPSHRADNGASLSYAAVGPLEVSRVSPSPIPGNGGSGVGNHISGLLDVSALATEVRNQIQQQQQQQQQHSTSAVGTAPLVTSTASSAAANAMSRELALLREQHEWEKLQLERRLSDAHRSARRYRQRLEGRHAHLSSVASAGGLGDAAVGSAASSANNSQAGGYLSDNDEDDGRIRVEDEPEADEHHRAPTVGTMRSASDSSPNTAHVEQSHHHHYQSRQHHHHARSPSGGSTPIRDHLNDSTSVGDAVAGGAASGHRRVVTSTPPLAPSPRSAAGHSQGGGASVPSAMLRVERLSQQLAASPLSKPR